MEPDDKIIQEIIDLVTRQPFAPSKVLQKNPKHKHLNDYIMAWTAHMPDILYCARIYYAIHKKKDYVKCANPNCINDVPHGIKFKPLVGPISTHCCAKCAQRDPMTQQKIEQTSLSLYGSRRPQQSAKYRECMSDKLQNMPKEHWDKAFKRRVKTCRKKYGVDTVSQVKEFKDKAVQSFKNRPEEAKKKALKASKQKRLERYGDYSNGKKISQTYKNFSKKKKAAIKVKRQTTLLKDYGVPCLFLADHVMHKSKIARLSPVYDEFLKNEHVEPMFSREEFIQHPQSIFKWRCKKCGNIFESMHRYVHVGDMHMVARCLNCYPLHCRQSKSETQMFNFIKSIYDGSIEQGNRTCIPPRELDIYIECKKLAIEYNGVAWHSIEYCTDKDYHLQKTIACEKQGIFLLHIFDVEWMYKKEQVKAFIERLLDHNQIVIDASSCDFCIVNRQDAQTFYENNSFIAYDEKLSTYGLKKDNDVVFCIQMDSNGKFSNMWPKVGITVNNALLTIVKCATDMHRRISFDIDRRLWPKTVLNGLNISSMHTANPQKKYCVRNPKGILVDSLSYENANALHYALYDSGKFVVECS